MIEQIGISWAQLVLLILTGWTLVGILGVALSFMQHERKKARHHLGWIAGVWLLYIAVLLTISLTSRSRSVPQGQDQCFNTLCFAVIKTEKIPGYLEGNDQRLLRVSIRITNHSRDKKKSDKRLQVYLVDAQNRRWDEIAGLEGVPLSTAVLPGNSILSEPVFRIAGDATGLRLILTHGHGLPYAFLLGDRDSLLHPAVSVPLEP